VQPSGDLRPRRVQVQNMIHFDAEEPLAQWDIQIQSVCNRVNDIIDNMSRAGLA